MKGSSQNKTSGTDKQKISLPQHMQLDMVSPATRLLEKRRVMYEVQKAFEDQKEDFKK